MRKPNPPRRDRPRQDRPGAERHRSAEKKFDKDRGFAPRGGGHDDVHTAPTRDEATSANTASTAVNWASRRSVPSHPTASKTRGAPVANAARNASAAKIEAKVGSRRSVQSHRSQISARRTVARSRCFVPQRLASAGARPRRPGLSLWLAQREGCARKSGAQIHKFMATENALHRLREDGISCRSSRRSCARKRSTRWSAPMRCIRACLWRPIPSPLPTSKTFPRPELFWCSIRSPTRTMSAPSCARQPRSASPRS